jgi:[histone H3]-lysine36 N-trimethyltransferase
MSKYAPPMAETTSLLSRPPPQAALVDTKVKREGFTTPPDSDVKLEPTSTTLTPSLQNLNIKMGVTTPKLDDGCLRPSPPDSKRDSSNSPPASDTKLVRKGALLIGELPRAETEARQTFTEIFDNQYQYGTLGRSREALESMTCDCQYEHGQCLPPLFRSYVDLGLVIGLHVTQIRTGVDDPVDACGHGSNCINRLTQVECMPDDCRCRNYCQNQRCATSLALSSIYSVCCPAIPYRFQRKQYGAMDIVKTEKKGFGLRAAASMQKFAHFSALYAHPLSPTTHTYARDTFVYEYVGEVVNTPSFKKRMRDYASEGIKHFYFMMLQKDEVGSRLHSSTSLVNSVSTTQFIDATKRGGIGRFANHSCNPNCYVAKWTVGQYVRMGIFAARNIAENEELTFNYNVDRYGCV